MPKGYFIYRQKEGNVFVSPKEYFATNTGGIATPPQGATRERLKERFGWRFAKWFDKLQTLGVGKHGEYEVSDSLPPGATIEVKI